MTVCVNLKWHGIAASIVATLTLSAMAADRRTVSEILQQAEQEQSPSDNKLKFVPLTNAGTTIQPLGDISDLSAMLEAEKSLSRPLTDTEKEEARNALLKFKANAADAPLVQAGGGPANWFERFIAWIQRNFGAYEATPTRPVPPAVGGSPITPPKQSQDMPQKVFPNINWAYNTDERAMVYQFPGNGRYRIEQCFGAIGPGCTPASPVADKVIRYSDGSISMMTSVGSIMHDLCCLRHSDGLHCQGADALSMAVDFADDGKLCAREWRKAVYDVANGRMWRATYGPYPRPDTGGDLRSRATGRTAVTYGRWGDKTTWGEMEVNATARLTAASGTYLDDTDASFCESGRFSRTWGQPTPWAAGYGMCQ